MRVSQVYALSDCAASSDVLILCTTPPGFGSQLAVVVFVAGQGSAVTPACLVSYASPAISSVVASGNDTLPAAGATLTVTGANFPLADPGAVVRCRALRRRACGFGCALARLLCRVHRPPVPWCPLFFARLLCAVCVGGCV